MIHNFVGILWNKTTGHKLEETGFFKTPTWT